MSCCGAAGGQIQKCAMKVRDGPNEIPHQKRTICKIRDGAAKGYQRRHKRASIVAIIRIICSSVDMGYAMPLFISGKGVQVLPRSHTTVQTLGFGSWKFSRRRRFEPGGAIFLRKAKAIWSRCEPFFKKPQRRLRARPVLEGGKDRFPKRPQRRPV